MRLLPMVVFMLALLSARAGAEPMKFVWPVPVKVKVTDRSTKGGVPVLMSYQFSLTPVGERLALKVQDFKILEVMGQDARQPALRKQLAEMSKVSQLTPTLIIDRAGALVEITDTERLIAKLIAGMPAKERAAARKVMSTPQFTAMIEQASGQLWNVWVGMWLGTDVQVGRTLEVERPVTLPNGLTLPRPVSLTNQGPAGPPGHVRLTFESSMTGDGKGKLGPVLQSLAQAASGGRPVPPDQLQGGAYVVAGEVITDPATLKPAAARWSERVSIQLRGQRPYSNEESHEFIFTWPKAKP
jgi:hypothetical protein